MLAKKSVLHLFSTLLVLTFALSFAGRAYSASAAFSKPAEPLLQFTSGGHVLGFTTQAMYAATGNHALRVNFAGANDTAPQTDSSIQEDGKPAPLSRVTYPSLWNGIDLVYSGTANSIYTTTYTLAPGADANDIRLRYNAPLALNKNGTLGIAFETGTLTESAPIAWQDIKPLVLVLETEGSE